MASTPNEFGHIVPHALEKEMRVSYLGYAMAVIVGRALPEVRDGLKPVHRRILYGMDQMGVGPSSSHKKCARIVGDVMGKYHPHGDGSIYDALTRLGQPFASRYPLVDGQGNFGDLDNMAAAMRYTEARLTRLATEMVRDLDEDTVDFGDNYDGQETEPLVLPSRFPNLLVNGSSGIAVGMATNMAPHNLGEAIDACVAMIDDPDIGLDALMERHIPGPDFPSGGTIMGLAGIRDAYATGRGRVVVRAKLHVEELKGGRTAVVVRELPYMQAIEPLVAKLGDLADAGVIKEIADVENLSGKAGLRINIILKRDAVAKVAVEKLWKHTSLQTTFGVNNLALVEGVPRTLSLRELLRHYLDHQVDVVVRRTKYRLRRAEERAHILEGYLIALDHLDEVIRVIRGSVDSATARAELERRYELSELQSTAILALRLSNLTSLERDKIRSEYDDKLEVIRECREILGDEAKVYAVIREELTEIRTIYADPRRTVLSPAEGEVDLESMIAEENMVVSVSRTGYVKRTAQSTYRQQKRGGLGVAGAKLRDADDVIEHFFVASTHDFLLFFTSRGRVFRQKVHELPEAARNARGRALVNYLGLAPGETVRALQTTRDFSDADFLVAATAKGAVKKTRFADYDTVYPAGGLIAVRIRDDDELIDVRKVNAGDELIMVSEEAMAVRFSSDDTRSMGRDTQGVIGMSLAAGDRVLGLEVARPGAELLVVTANGFGKRTRVEEYRGTRRGAKGVMAIKLTDKRGRLVAVRTVREHHQLLILSELGQVVRIAVGEVHLMGRTTQGYTLMRLRDDDRVVAVARAYESDGAADVGLADSAAADAADEPADDEPADGSRPDAPDPGDDSA